MRRFVAFLIAAVVAGASLPGCCPCRHLATSSHDSVRVETIVYTEVVRDTVLVEIPVEVVRETVRDTTSHLETSYAASDARINADGSLFHSLENKAGNRPVEVETQIIYRDSIIYRDRADRAVVEVERELTAWQRFRLRAFWGLLVVLVFLVRRHIMKMI